MQAKVAQVKKADNQLYEVAYEVGGTARSVWRITCPMGYEAARDTQHEIERMGYTTVIRPALIGLVPPSTVWPPVERDAIAVALGLSVIDSQLPGQEVMWQFTCLDEGPSQGCSFYMPVGSTFTAVARRWQTKQKEFSAPAVNEVTYVAKVYREVSTEVRVRVRANLSQSEVARHAIKTATNNLNDWQWSHVPDSYTCDPDSDLSLVRSDA